MPGEVDSSEIEEKTPFTEQLWGRVIPVGNIYDPQHNIDALPEFAEDEEWINFIPSPDGELQFYMG